MTAEEFTASGRRWNMVYVVNSQELDFYITGADVLREGLKN
jgi:ATP phosphoribosyltransferase